MEMLFTFDSIFCYCVVEICSTRFLKYSYYCDLVSIVSKVKMQCQLDGWLWVLCGRHKKVLI